MPRRCGILRAPFGKEFPRGLLLEGSAASGASCRKALFFNRHADRRGHAGGLPRAGLFWKGPPRLEAFLRNALARLEPVREQDPGDDGVGRVRPFLQNVKAPVLRA